MARRKKGENIHGWLVVDKPQGISSNDVVNKTRRLFDAKKNGHTGTLDPFATGVLVIAFGEATKLIPLVSEGEKEYEFVTQWGKETDTLDTEGEVVASSDKMPSKDEIEAVLPSFLGKIKQVPPAYSAIKVNGERAYNLARKGEEVDIPEREIEIFELELLKVVSLDKAKFRVRCSKGTYVRTLGRDLALMLGSRGYLVELKRTKNGVFGLDDAKNLETLEKMMYKEGLLATQACLRDIAVIAVSEEDAAKLRLGQGLSPKAYPNFEGTAVAEFDKELVAIVEMGERKISPIRVFNFD